MENKMNTHMSESAATAYTIINRAAKAGNRAPFNSDLPNGAGSVRWLYRNGYITIELYARNWRVIEIRSSGERTQSCPGNHKPYKILGGSDIPLKTAKPIPTKEEREATALAVTAE